MASAIWHKFPLNLVDTGSSFFTTFCSFSGEREVRSPAGAGDRSGEEHGGQPGLGHAARPQGQVLAAQEPEHAVPGEDDERCITRDKFGCS